MALSLILFSSTNIHQKFGWLMSNCLILMFAYMAASYWVLIFRHVEIKMNRFTNVSFSYFWYKICSRLSLSLSLSLAGFSSFKKNLTSLSVHRHLFFCLHAFMNRKIFVHLLTFFDINAHILKSYEFCIKTPSLSLSLIHKHRCI